MKCIVQIGPYPLTSDCIKGGVEASVYGLAQEQGKDGEVHVFDLPRKGMEDSVCRDGNVIVHRFLNSGKRQVSIVKQVKRIIHEIVALNPSICHIHGTSLYAFLMYRGLVKRNISVIVTVHGLLLVEKRNLLRSRYSLKYLGQYLYQGWVEKMFLKQLSMAIVDTEYVKQMISCYPIKKIPKMHVIPQGISEVFFSLNCSQDSCILLSVGAMGERKGHLLTLEAYGRLRQDGINAKLVIVGTVADQTYYEKMQQLVSKSEYKEDIQLLPNLPQQELQKLYECAQVFVLHSEEESQGIAFAEAMATGMPVVSTIVGGVPFVVHQGKTGLLSEYGNVQAFKENMKVMLMDAQRWQAMSSKSKTYANSYHWSMIKSRIDELCID